MASIGEVVSLVSGINASAIESMVDGKHKEASKMMSDALRIIESHLRGPTTLADLLIFSQTPLMVDQRSLIGTYSYSSLSQQQQQRRCCDSSGGTSVSSSSRSGSYTTAPTQPLAIGDLRSINSVPIDMVRRRLNVRLPEHDRQQKLTTAIYNRAFFICKEGPCNPRLAAAVLLFNNGLCHHLHSISKTEDSCTALGDALVLYNQAYSIVIQESRIMHENPILRDRTQSRLVVLLAAALCHNMAAIHGDFWDYNQARLLRCQLAQVIHWEGSHFSQMETDDFVFFHLGIFFAIIDDFRIAPAA